MKKYIIYGAGWYGKSMYHFLKHCNMDRYVYAFIDKNSKEMGNIEGINFISISEAVELELPVIVAIENPEIRDAICDELNKQIVEVYDDFSPLVKYAGKDLDEFYREYCIYNHVNDMNNYFEMAESQTALDTFWNEDSDFLQKFNKLDTSNIIEFACGRGRHVEMYRSKVKQIVLVDAVEDNIEYCRTRFGDNDNIQYYCNNGVDLSELADDTYSALFTYDAMVHFEMLDVANYLKEFQRVLKKGAYALIHHSNNTQDYKVSYSTAKCGRNYMSAEIFAYLAYRAGFDIVEQKVIDWGVKDIDCISLIKKK